jgi:hypothetical protein
MRRALLVGINDYGHDSLSAPVNDARAMERLLSTDEDGTPNFDTKLLISGESYVDRPALLEAVEFLLRDPADVALLYFSGHGTENNLDGYLVTSDASKYKEGAGLSEVLNLADEATQIREIILIIDSCHSGSLGNLPTVKNTASLREGLSIMTASRGNQAAMESDGSSVFTKLVCEALDGGAADILGKVSVAGIYAYVEQALGWWGQRPLLKSHVSSLLSLRKCKEAVDVALLRRLPEWFDTPDADFPLSPRDEPTEDPRDADAEQIFGCLQKCNRVKLVEPVGEEHMYFAAINNKSCRLTPMGRCYWELAKRKRI